MSYSRNEYRAIHDFLVEQSAEIEEYLDETRKEYQEKPNGTTRMNHQWATKIKGYVDFLITAVSQEIKDVK